MSTERNELDVRRGRDRLTSVWLAPAATNDHDEPALASAGEWVEKHPQTFARVKAAIPVTVGSTLRIF